MNRMLKVALVQEMNRGDAEANLACIEQRVAEAAAGGAKLVLLQELHNGAYFCQHESTHEFDRAEPIPGPSTERLGALARKHGVVLVSSLFERRAAGLYHNTAVVFETDGSIAGKYRKMHIPDDPLYYEKSPARNPTGPATGTHKVLRSSGWEVETPLVRSVTRVKSDPLNRTHSTGFRCALSVAK